MSLKRKLKHFGGEGCFDKILSTSNLYKPDFNRVFNYLKNYRPSHGNEKPLSELLEERLCEYHDSDYCVLFSSGFWALVTAIKLKSFEGRDNVIIPSMTYRRLADVVKWSGKVPVFVDVCEHNLAISVEAVRDSIDNNTALILAVHPIVNCCDVDSFISLSEESNIPVLFDAVESVHETYKGRRVGSYGCGEVFSLHASKLINGCEGGYVCTSNGLFASQLRSLRHFGVSSSGDQTIIGSDSRPIDIHSAFALACLDEIEINVDHNREIYYAYKRCLSGMQGLRLLEFDETEQTSYKNIVLEVCDQFPLSRDALVMFLNGEGLLARKHYDPPLHTKEYAYDVVITDMQNTDNLHSRFINMPCGSKVTVEDVEKIVEILRFISSDSYFETLGVNDEL